jgi:hypothetical protein
MVCASNSATIVEIRKFDFLLLILFNPNSSSECGRFSAVIPLAVKTGNVNFCLGSRCVHVILLKDFGMRSEMAQFFYEILNDNF